MDALLIDPFDIAMVSIALRDFGMGKPLNLEAINKTKEILDQSYGEEYSPSNLPLSYFAKKAMEAATCGKGDGDPIEFMRSIQVDLEKLCADSELLTGRTGEISFALYTFAREVQSWREYMHPTRPWL